MSNDYRVMFLRSNDGRPIGCVAIAVDRKKRTLRYGLSVLNPADKFDRKVARQLAIGRLIEVPASVSVRADANMHDITRTVMQDLLTDIKTPSRAVRAAKFWLTNKSNVPFRWEY